MSKKGSTRIRLQRHGRKNYAFYSIVIANANAPRDGRFIEKLGTYNPNTDPATISLNFERALYWVEVGAQPTDTVRNILSKEGVYLMKHLKGGVKKGAFDEAAAESKFAAWKAEKAQKAAKYAEDLAKADKANAKARLEAEKKANEAVAAKVAEKKLLLLKLLQRLLLKTQKQLRLLKLLKLLLRHQQRKLLLQKLLLKHNQKLEEKEVLKALSFQDFFIYISKGRFPDA